ncbi:tetratricopeptide repeat protein [Aeromicrobium sp. SMF47]|uniref:Tetratricopeptide repeat protein n=1 Tax=Aeromicrobium yanjiei TaxID=2662028 RepID=A0A5Q2MIP9_9ACTN|nr:MULTISPECIES: tetratricopeptide repeat protein [Aeromicrobium]MRJ77225.1 tetratricopeptide repeat protein [Aeromicrobium yanjiei]MRK01592.1 tetratricopeptide repeat protein [Aeromicrobium sp. S22]QGG41641.1 tetratricopeptide repeat protein [Aeromicrobium yanjiei]
MAESRNPRRDGGKPAGRGAGSGGARGGKPESRGGRDQRGSGSPDRRDGKPARGGKPDARRDGKPDARRDGRPAHPRRDGKAYDAPRNRRQEEGDRTAAQKIYDGPPIPDDVSAKDLDKHARQALQSLPEKLADKVARHLVMAGMLIAEDPETAHRHALAARARATRTGLVREACGETAYACGKWAEALSEFRAARRMTGGYMYAPMMADCERALKRPDKAIAYDTPEIRGQLDDAGQIELSIVVAGARRDQGQYDAAVRLLETEPLHTKGRGDWVPRLRYAYADALLDAGRRDEAIEWFHRTVAVDGNKSTDAEERLRELDKRPQD